MILPQSRRNWPQQLGSCASELGWQTADSDGVVRHLWHHPLKELTLHNQTLIRRYNAAAPQWAARVAALGYPAAYAAFARAALPHLSAPASLCDIGCGSGSFTQAVLTQLQLRPMVTLVDPSAQMLTQAATVVRPKTAALTLCQSTLHCMQGQFDLLLAAHVIEHCPDPKAAIADLSRLTRPGGAILLIVSRPHWCQWLIWPVWRHRWFSATQVIGWAGSAGLTPVLIHHFAAGPPSRTSLGYLFIRPSNPKDTSC